MKFWKSMKSKHVLMQMIRLMFSNTTSNILSESLIILSFFQISSYIFKLNYTQFSDSKLIFFMQLLYYCNFSNLLFFFSSTTLTYACFILMLVMLHFILLFPIILTFVMKFFKIHKSSILLNFFSFLYRKLFESFLWIILTPCIEFSMNITDCEGFSYIAENRNNPQCQITVLLWIGAIWTCFICFVITFLYMWTYTDNTFLDTKSVKMSFNFWYFGVFLSRYVFVIVFPLIYNKTPGLIYLFLHAIAFFGLFDYIIYFPIRNQGINKKYVSFLCSMEGFFIMMTLWAFTNLISESDLFYVLVVVIVFSYKFGTKMHELIYMKIISSDFTKNEYLSYLLEEIMLLFGNINFPDKESLLFGIFRKHLKFCNEKKCKLSEKHVKIFENSEENERIKILNNFIQQKFKKTISELNKTYKSNKTEIESFLLKYMSFLTNYNPNPLKAYFEIQQIMQRQENPSFLFKSYRKILMKEVKKAILLKDKELLLTGKLSLSYSDKELEVNEFIKIMKEKTILEKEALSVLKTKVKFWDKYKDGFQSYSEVINEIRGLISKIQGFKRVLIEKTQVFNNKSRNLFPYKFLSFLHCILYNDINEAMKLEEEVETTKKREYSHEKNGTLGYLSFFEDNVIPLKVSFLTHKGAILEESKTLRLARFFQYEKDELKNLCLFNLMPEIIADHHDGFLAWQLTKTTNQKQNLNKYIDSYARFKSGLIFPIKVYIGYGFEHKQDFVLQGLISQDTSTVDQNFKSFIFDEKGNMHGIDTGFFELFSKEFPKIELEDIKYMNIYNLIPGLLELLEKNDVFKKKVNLYIRNQLALMLFPKNLKEILEILRLKRKEEHEFTNKLSYYSGITSKTSKTEKSKKSSKNNSNRSLNNDKSLNIDQSDKKSNKNKKQFLTILYNTKPDISLNKRSLLEEKSNNDQLIDKEILDELIERNNCFKYKIYFDIKIHYYMYGEKNHQNIGVFYIKIAKIRSITTNQSFNDPSKLTFTSLRHDPFVAYKEDTEIADIESGFIQMPPDNVASFRQTPFNDEMNFFSTERERAENPENMLYEIHEEVFQRAEITHNKEENLDKPVVILTTNANLLTINEINNTLRSEGKKIEEEISKEESVHESQEVKNKEELIKNSTDKMKAVEMQSGKASSISSVKKGFSIFQSIQALQRYFPPNLNRLSLSITLELLLIGIFCIIIYLFSAEYLTNYYDPLESALESFSKMTTAFCTVTLATTQIELYQKNLNSLDPLSEDVDILFQILNITFTVIKSNMNDQRNLQTTFDYQTILKTRNIKNTETTFYTTSQMNFLDALDTILATLGDAMIATIDTESQQILEYIPLNFGYVIDNFNDILDSISSEFFNSNQDTSRRILIAMLVFILIMVPLKLIELKEIQIFYRELLKLLNIFLRINQKAAYNELLFMKDILEKTFDAEKCNYLYVNFPEKVINKRSVEIQTDLITENSINNKTNKKQKKQTLKNSLKFSFHNLKALSLFKIKAIILLSFVLSFSFYFFIYLYWIIIDAKITELIQIHNFFYNFYTMPSHTLALNLLLMRQIVTYNPILENSGEDTQTTAGREAYFRSEMTDHLHQLTTMSINFPTYLFQVSDNINSPILNDLITSDVCDLLGREGVLDIHEIALCQEVLDGSFLEGLISVLNQMVTIVKQQANLLGFIGDNVPTVDEVKTYLKSEECLDTVLAEHFFENGNEKLFSFLTDYYTHLIINEISNLQLMILLFTIGIGIFMIVIGIAIRISYQRLFKDITLGLSLIPYERLINDEQTVFLIKKYIKK